MCFIWFKKRLDITCIVFLICFSTLYFYVPRFKEGLNSADKSERRVLVYGSYTTKVQSFRSTDKIEDKEAVDIVYTWVDGSDLRFRQDLEKYLETLNRKDGEQMVLNRYFDFGPLKFSLRSVEQNANWIRKIFIVTNGQAPSWLKLDNPRLTLVTHEQIFQNKSDLPTFSAQAVECRIHRIKELSKRFIYMYDDIIFTTEVVLEDFVTQSGSFKVRFYNRHLKGCNRKCHAENVNNGRCEQNCYTESCEWDGDDCIGKDVDPYTESDKNDMFDSWKGSILHTNFLFNKAFGPRSRQIPNSGPLFLDKDILHQLNERFPDEWERTSSQKIRHHLSVNMEFAYYNFLVEAEIMGTSGIKTSSTQPTKCCEMEKLVIDNRNDALWRQQLLDTKREIILKTPKFLIVARKFTKRISNQRKSVIKLDLESFFEKMFPKPSMFEK